MTIKNLTFIPVFHNIKNNVFPNVFTNFLLDGHIGNCLDFFGKFHMAVNVKFSTVFSLIHALADNSDEPDDTKNVIYMLMGYENVMDVGDIKI